MVEGPILFSGPMVRALLEGIKTQTRRVMRLPLHDRDFGCDLAPTEIGEKDIGRLCPYGAPGDRLWVRETWYIDTIDGGGPIPKERGDIENRDIYYRADGECCDQIPECDHTSGHGAIWRPSIHMPRWVCRLTLDLSAVRVERLQDISAEDVRDEGFPGYPTCNRDNFIALWDRLNGHRAPWASNPWVWVLHVHPATEQHS